MRQRTSFQRIDMREARRLITRRDVLVLDVRDAESFNRAHIKGARNVSIVTLSDVINTTPKSMIILIYCYRGYASQEYAQIFSDFGFPIVYSLDGGYDAWSNRPRMASSMIRQAAAYQ